MRSRFISHLLAFFIVFAITASSALATDYFVRKTGNNANAGTSAATAWLTVDHAADNVVAGDTVYVGAGTYTENIHPAASCNGTSVNPIRFEADTNGSQTGDAGNVVLTSTTGLVIQIGRFGVVNNYLEFVGFKIIGSDSHAVYGDASTGIVFDGCEIYGASSNGLRFDTNEITIRNCSFHDNGASGIYLLGATGTIEDTSVYANTQFGSILISSGATATLNRCHIYDNNTEGIKVNNGTATIRNCLITGNSSDGISVDYVAGNLVTVQNCTVAQNTRFGFYFNGGTNAITNCIVANNIDTGVTDNTSSTRSNNLIFGNGSGNTAANATEIVADPRFASASDYHITLFSPAKDAGTDLSGTVDDDFDGLPRPINGAYDIGCYEEGPVGHWKLNESIGTTAVDDSGSNNDGTYVNGPVLGGSGPHGNSVEFNLSDTDDRVDLPHTVLDGAMDASVAFWIKTTHTGEAAVLSGANSSSYNQFIVFFSNNTRISLFKNEVSLSFGIESVADDQWHHFVFTWNGNTNEVILYQDGALVGSGTMAGTTGVPISIDPGGLMLAQEQDSVGGSFATSQVLRGSLDDVRIYNRPLTSQEAAQLGATDLVGHWKLDETSGTLAADSSGLGNDGTYTNGPTLGIEGIHASAADFDGIDDYVLIPDTPSLRMDDSFSLSAWIKIDTLPNTDHMIINKEGEYEIALLSDGQLAWGIDNTDPNWSWHGTGYYPTVGTWTHVAMTYDVGTAKVYVNGQLIDTYIGSGPVEDAYPTKNSLRIGGRENNPSGKYFSGLIDDVRLYARAISEEDIQDLYGPVGHWKLDETSGLVAADSARKGNDGTYENGTVIGQPGAMDQSAQFDGSDDRVLLPQMDCDFSGGISVAVWVKPNSERTDFATFFSLSNGANADDIWIGWDNDQGAEIFLSDTVEGDAFIALVDSALLTVGAWQHYVFTIDSSGNAKIYRNGTLSASGNIGTPKNLNRTTNMIGRSAWGYPFDGHLDDILLYDRQLSETEIAELYGLMGHWKLDETSGTVAADSTIFAGDGTYVNDPVLGNCGPYWKSAEFNMTDTNDRVDLPHTALDGAIDASVAFWIKTTNTGQAAVLSGSDSGNHNEFLAFFNHDKRLSLFKHNASYGFTIPSVADDQWTHFAFTWKGNTNQVTLYRNGQLVGSGTMGGTTGLPINIDPGGLVLAQEQDSVGGGFDANQTVKGSLDDVRIYNRAIQAKEAAELYGLMGHWKLDETAGVVAADATIFGHDGTYINGPVLNNTGKVDKAVNFDGSNDRIEVGSMDVSGSSLTISAWIKANSYHPTGTRIVAKANGSGLSNNWWSLTTYNAGGGINRLGMLFKTTTLGTQFLPASSGDLPTGVWIHVAAVYNGSSMELYKDGVLVDSLASSGDVAIDSTVPMWISASPSSEKFFNGLVDDVRIYNRPLCFEEVQDLASGGLHGIRIIKWVETL